MTHAAIAGRYRGSAARKANSADMDATVLDGHVTEFETRMAARGEVSATHPHRYYRPSKGN